MPDSAQAHNKCNRSVYAHPLIPAAVAYRFRYTPLNFLCVTVRDFVPTRYLRQSRRIIPALHPPTPRAYSPQAGQAHRAPRMTVLSLSVHARFIILDQTPEICPASFGVPELAVLILVFTIDCNVSAWGFRLISSLEAQLEVNLTNTDFHAHGQFLKQTAEKFNVSVDFDTESRTVRFRNERNRNRGHPSTLPPALSSQGASTG